MSKYSSCKYNSTTKVRPSLLSAQETLWQRTLTRHLFDCSFIVHLLCKDCYWHFIHKYHAPECIPLLLSRFSYFTCLVAVSQHVLHEYEWINHINKLSCKTDAEGWLGETPNYILGVQSVNQSINQSINQSVNQSIIYLWNKHKRTRQWR